jgi:hypothetical protein
LWAAVTPTTTVYAILPGRGFAEAACLLGPAFAGVLLRDACAPYQQFTEAAHQTCLTHLGRRARELRTDYPRTVLPGEVEEVLHDALDVRDRYGAGTISEHRAAIARGRLLNRLSTVLDQSTTVVAIRRFVAHLNREWTALFSLLFDLEIDATSYRAEHAIRWAVVTRKMCGGAIAPPAVRSRSMCSHACCEPPDDAASIVMLSSSRCSEPQHSFPYPRSDTRRAAQDPGNQLHYIQSKYCDQLLSVHRNAEDTTSPETIPNDTSEHVGLKVV